MISVLKGMKDRHSDDVRKYDFIVDTAKKVFSKYGFERIITPILEETELFRRSVGDETDVVSKEMYEFKDKGNRSVSMRPEGTAGVVRAYLEAGLHKSDPIVKWFYNGPMYRKALSICVLTSALAVLAFFSLMERRIIRHQVTILITNINTNTLIRTKSPDSNIVFKSIIFPNFPSKLKLLSIKVLRSITQE